jgi:hypothetical protein
MDYCTDLVKLLADINASNLTAEQKEHGTELVLMWCFFSGAKLKPTRKGVEYTEFTTAELSEVLARAGIVPAEALQQLGLGAGK